MNGRFLLNRQQGKVLGVAAGLADWTGIDALVIPHKTTGEVFQNAVDLMTTLNAAAAAAAAEGISRADDPSRGVPGRADDHPHARQPGARTLSGRGT